jgi:hypothetical protein
LSCLTRVLSSCTTCVLRFSAMTSCWPAWSPSSFRRFLYAFVYVNLEEEREREREDEDDDEEEFMRPFYQTRSRVNSSSRRGQKQPKINRLNNFGY